MSNSGENIRKEGERDSLSLFDGGSVSWDKSKEDIWGSMEDKLQEQKQVKVVSMVRRSRVLAAAALVLLLLGIPSVMRFYTKTIVSGSGEHLEISLPDRSMISMNAESEVKYKPLWWRFNRDVSLTGEAFFDVEPGSTFEVKSKRASTMVVGTSFNIVARGEKYEVTCLTGKVKVSTVGNTSTLFLEPDQRAILLAAGNFSKEDNIKAAHSISWIDNQFFFTSVSLDVVFDEIERQFGISIQSQLSGEFIYTGNFSKNEGLETILDLVCKPFGIKFDAVKSGTYLITTDEDLQ